MPGPRILTMYGWKGTRSHQDQAKSPSTSGEASILGRKAVAVGQTRPLLAASKALSVAQGSMQLDAAQLIEPTFRTLASDDVRVITALGQRCASLFSVPPNAKILDYFPYDAILVHADVFVSNGGYGGATQAVRYGVPIVRAGEEYTGDSTGGVGRWEVEETVDGAQGRGGGD